ncbi:MAG TPA: alpha/beta fold hydrolase [Kofleriaceae bacterium]|nr:alpha/beta fold hydrolase [Kofleriaceae bacterium]
MLFATAGDGARLAYEVLGDGPPLLLVAGQASDRHVWDRVRDDFAAHHRVIVFDHRGTGASDKPAAPPYSTRGFAADAIAVLDAAGAARAHVYGISMGGRIGQWLAIEHAARLGALVLGCTTPGNAHGVRRPREVDPALASGEPARMVPYLVSPAWQAAHPELLADLEAAARDRPVPPHARRLHYQASEAHDAWDRLPEIAAPTLVIHGIDDQVNVAANASLLVGRIPGAELYLISGGRHAYFLEYRRVASDVVLGFLALHPID